jgi:hypothetical protein
MKCRWRREGSQRTKQIRLGNPGLEDKTPLAYRIRLSKDDFGLIEAACYN